MSKDGLTIDNSYLRSDPDFSLPAKGQEDLASLESGKCNYYTARTGVVQPSYICNTYSVGNLDNTLAKMILPANGDIKMLRGPGVSVHYLLDEDGTIYQLVPNEGRAWCAGLGALRTGSKLNADIPDNMKNGMNDHCISVMYINDGKRPLTEAQITNGISLTKALIVEHHIPSEHVLGLGDFAPLRHFAPGAFHPWEEFAKNKLGLWSDVERKSDPETTLTFYNSTSSSEELDPIRSALGELGMVGEETDVGLMKLMRNFNIHHLGKEITTNPTLTGAYNDLWTDSNNLFANQILSTWTENSQNILENLLSGESLHHSDY